MRRLLLILVCLGPAAALAQPPPATKALHSLRTALTAPILKATPRKLDTGRATPRGVKPIRTVRARFVPRGQHLTQPSPLHLLGSSLQGLPPPVPPALLNQPVERPTALRQLQFQLDLLHVGSR